MRKTLTYKNPWYEQLMNKSLSGPYFTRTDCVVKMSDCGRGILLKLHNDFYEYIVNGRLITQRAGGNLGLLNDYTKYIMDGIDFEDLSYNKERIMEAYGNGAES